MILLKIEDNVLYISGVATIGTIRKEDLDSLIKILRENIIRTVVLTDTLNIDSAFVALLIYMKKFLSTNTVLICHDLSKKKKELFSLYQLDSWFNFHS